MTTTTQPYGRGRPYPVQSMTRARELGEAGWYPSKIRELMIGEGLATPDLMTIKRWVNDEYNESMLRSAREANARRRSRTATFRLPGAIRRAPTQAYRAAFVEALERAGVSADEIPKVCAVVLGQRRGEPAPARDETDRGARLLAAGLEMRERGMPYPWISLAFELYEGERMGPDTLRHWLTMNGAERNPRKRRPHLNAPST